MIDLGMNSSPIGVIENRITDLEGQITFLIDKLAKGEIARAQTELALSQVKTHLKDFKEALEKINAG